MSDDIMGIFAEGEKKKSQPYYATTNDTLHQLDLRWPSGYRVFLPYRHLHEVQYVPAKADGLEEIRIHFPGFSALTIRGHVLIPLYEAFSEYKVQWMRERGKEEDVTGVVTYIEKLDYFPLTDWEFDAWAVEQRRAEYQKS